jgi:nucleotide-binding universal stress UspA family protein
MLNTIVVGVDARDGGRDALALGAALARPLGAVLLGVHVYPLDAFLDRTRDGSFEAAMHQAAKETLEAELDRAGVNAHAQAVPDASPARALHRVALRERADLIVVGSTHRAVFGRVLPGDVTTGTLHGAPCPVLVAPRGSATRDGSFERIGVAFDGSAEARAAADLAREIAVATGARLRVMEVVPPATPGSGPYHSTWADAARARREVAQERVARVAAELGEVAAGDILLGEPARELTYEGTRLDLLVMGSRDYGPVRRLMLGSTSSNVVRAASCPVLVLARGDREDETESIPLRVA